MQRKKKIVTNEIVRMGAFELFSRVTLLSFFYLHVVCKQHASCKEILTRICNFYTLFFDFTQGISHIKLVGIEFNVNKISTIFFCWRGLFSRNVFGVWSFFGVIVWSMNSHGAIGIQAQSTNKTNEIENCVHVFLCGWLC